MLYSIKENRIDQMLRSQGYIVSDCQLFYSPIKATLYTWALFFLSFLLIQFLPASAFLFYANAKFLLPVLSLYFLIGYFVTARLNNSFVICGDTLLVINPYFHYKQLVRYEIKDLQWVCILEGGSTVSYYGWLFFQYNHRVQVKSSNQVREFYCCSIDFDDFSASGNLEKNLYDLYLALRALHVQVNIEDDMTKTNDLT